MRPRFFTCAAPVVLAALALGGCGDRVSRGLDGKDSNGPSGQASTWLERPGPFEATFYVAFASRASNLVGGDTNHQSDVFLYVGDGKNGDGGTGKSDVRRVGAEGTSGQGNGPTWDPAVSRRAAQVSVTSKATNLVPGDSNRVSDVFVVDTAKNSVERVSVSSSGKQANGASRASSITADGRYVAFVSAANNLVAGDRNGRDDVFVRDLKRGSTRRVSLDVHGGNANAASSSPAIAGGGRYVAFVSKASDLVRGDTNRRADVFVRDLRTGRTTRISMSPHHRSARGTSTEPAISPDGRLVAFSSTAANLVVRDSNRRRDVFVRDRKSGVTRLVSVNGRGKQGNGDSSQPTLVQDRYLAFTSSATNLVPGDRNRHRDVFMTSYLHRKQIVRVSEGTDKNGKAIAGNGDSLAPSLSVNQGVFAVAFTTNAANIGYSDHNHVPDVLFTGDVLAGG